MAGNEINIDTPNSILILYAEGGDWERVCHGTVSLVKNYGQWRMLLGLGSFIKDTKASVKFPALSFHLDRNVWSKSRG